MNAFARRVLTRRAQEYIKKYTPTLIGVTGSYGNTLTKQAIARVLDSKHTVRIAPQPRLHIDEVPAAMLGISKPSKRHWVRMLIGSKVREIAEDPEPDVIVVELPADSPGDIDRISMQFPFAIGVIGNVATADLDVFATKQMVAHEYESLAAVASNAVVVSADDPVLSGISGRATAPAVLFGDSKHARVRIVRAQRTGTMGFALEMNIAGRSYECTAPYLAARHQLQSMSAALAVAHVMGCDISRAIKAVRTLRPPAGHMRVFEGVRNATILDDTHDGTLEDTVLALKTLQAVGGSRRVVVLGDLRNMGGQSARLYEKLGQRIAKSADIFIAVGSDIRVCADAALQSGGVDVHHFGVAADAGKWIADVLRGQEVVLVKGSRSMQMEVVVSRLLANPIRDAAALVKA